MERRYLIETVEMEVEFADLTSDTFIGMLYIPNLTVKSRLNDLSKYENEHLHLNIL